MEDTKLPYLLLLFPLEKVALGPLMSGVRDALERLAGEPPHLVYPNATCVALLTMGNFVTISAAIRRASNGQARWLLLPAIEPYEAPGLDATAGWLRTRRP